MAVRGTDYVLKRLFFAGITVFVAVTINFVLFRLLPGSAVSNLARVPHASAALKAELTREFGLDKPMWQQYVIYLGQLAHLHMGVSWVSDSHQPVWTYLRGKLANTIPMAALGTAVAIVIGIGSGVVSAWRRGSKTDHVSTNVAIAFYAFPTQWLALMLLILFAGVLPVNGMHDPFLAADVGGWTRFLDTMRHMILPSLAFALTLYGEFTLIVRSAMLETLGEDYVLTARAKGLSSWGVVRTHATRNAMLPTTTLIALSLGYIVAGAILIETVFTWPGIGLATYQAVVSQDYPVLQGAFLVLTISVVFFNLLADLLYFKLDPRISA
ncbi:MAG: peptide/nickel transport system permease protein [Actinomycetota bacterium]|nr:peptide/nickel transport system permease protein [Actinomycetota bacterium]